LGKIEKQWMNKNDRGNQPARQAITSPFPRRMKVVTQHLRRLFHDESGQDLIEYALIGALVAIVAITGLNSLAGKINSEYSKIGSDL
jgi:pilus assembly protein Flp/PilA